MPALGQRRSPVYRPDREAIPARRGAPGRQLVLVADEDSLMADLLSHALERANLPTYRTSDGAEVTAVAARVGADAAVISRTLPGRNGDELIRELRAHPATGDIAIIMLTWPGDDMAAVSAFEAGADEVIEKPISPLEFVARVRRLIRPRAPKAPRGARSA